MADAAVAAVFVFAVVVLTATAAILWNKYVLKMRTWIVDEEPARALTGGRARRSIPATQVYVRRGRQKMLIGSPVPLDDAFSMAIEERRAQAYQQAVALNSR